MSWLEQQLDEIDTLVVAVGGGGLVSGIATWFDGGVRVVAVEPEQIPTLYAAQNAGRPVDVEVGGIATDALGARCAGASASGSSGRVRCTPADRHQSRSRLREVASSHASGRSGTPRVGHVRRARSNASARASSAAATSPVPADSSASSRP